MVLDKRHYLPLRRNQVTTGQALSAEEQGTERDGAPLRALDRWGQCHKPGQCCDPGVAIGNAGEK
jgi:hypothetical protein